MTNNMTGVLHGAERLWPHNDTVSGFDPLLYAAVETALSNNTDPIWERGMAEGFIEAMPQVRLIFVKTDPAPMPFLDALEADRQCNIYAPCDRCGDHVVPTARLWLPAGGSIVQVECCDSCQRDLPGLVWR